MLATPHVPGIDHGSAHRALAVDCFAGPRLERRHGGTLDKRSRTSMTRTSKCKLRKQHQRRRVGASGHAPTAPAWASACSSSPALPPDCRPTTTAAARGSPCASTEPLEQRYELIPPRLRAGSRERPKPCSPGALSTRCCFACCERPPGNCRGFPRGRAAAVSMRHASLGQTLALPRRALTAASLVCGAALAAAVRSEEVS